MGIKVANNAFGTLAASITNSDTSITLTTGQGARFPSLGAGDYFYATLIDTSNNLEIVKCTARSTDVLTVVRAQESTTARAYSTGDRIEIRITAKTFEDAIPTVYDVTTTSTGFFDMPAGTTAQRPGSPTSGATRFNTDTGSLEFYDGTNWISTNLIPSINSVTGTIYAGQASTLTLSLTNTTDTITVRFSEGGSIIADVADVAVSAGSASVAVPSAVYGQTAGDTIAVSVLNSDGTPSSNAISKTVAALPTGGTITTSGGYRYHTFTSSSSFVVPSGLSVSAEYLIVAGGGSGGVWAEASNYTNGNQGANSSFNSQTAIGGGGGRAYNRDTTNINGGSGGGGGGGSAASAGSGTAGQGNAGGNAGGADTESGGGGGAGAVGQAGASLKMGDGGAGLNWKSLGTFYAGGGGGGGANGAGKVRGLGGTGGGGAGGVAGSANPFPENGTTNRGGGGGAADGWWGQNHGGGGGGGYIDSSATLSAGTYGVTIGGGGAAVGVAGPATVSDKNVLSGAGGSGIVIVRYQL